MYVSPRFGEDDIAIVTCMSYVDKIWAFFDHLPPCVDIFYGITVDKKWTFLDHLPKRSF